MKLVPLAALALACASATAQTLAPSNPVAVPAGGTYQFSAQVGSNPVWSVVGQGTVDQSGLYHAPASVIAQNQSRGCQELPNNAPFNVPVDQLPVDSHSSRWLTRISTSGQEYPSYHSFKIYTNNIGLYDNPVDHTTPQQLMHFYYADRSQGYQDTNFPIPTARNWMMESGASLDGTSAVDRHVFTMNTETCQNTEMYNLYADFHSVSLTPGNPTRVSWTTHTVWPLPQNYLVVISGGTGAWSAANGQWRMTLTGQNAGTLPFNSANWGPAPGSVVMGSTGCASCNSQGGQKFSPSSYAMLGGVDAASMPMSPLSLKMEEWYAATQAGRNDVGHAIRTTIGNWYLSARNIWPALGVANAQDGITAATNGRNPTFTVTSDIDQLYYHPCDNYTWTRGCHFHVVFFGLSGAWAAANGDQEAVAIDGTHFSVPALDTTSWGPFHAGYGVYLVPDYMPYGATLRLKASVNVNAVCGASNDLNAPDPYCRVLLNTMKKYGLVMADGTVPSDNWDSSAVSSEFHPKMLLDAAALLRHSTALQPLEPNLEVVNRSSQQLSDDPASYLQSNVNRTYVQACGSAGCAKDDVLLQGTTIGTDRERLTMAAGVAYQMKVWVNGNTSHQLSYHIGGISGASVSSSGVVTMPNCSTKQQGMITVSSAADSHALPLYVEVACLPVSNDGAYRLALGNFNGDYSDSTGKTWYGAWANNGFNNGYEAPGLWWGNQNGTWQGIGPCSGDTWSGTDLQLFARSTDINNDTKVEVIVPNGNYQVTLYGEPGFGGFGQNNTCGNQSNQNVFDWQVQGQTVQSWIDGYSQAGNRNYHGYTLVAPATVTDNQLTLVGRIRLATVYGVSWSSLLIVPTGTQQSLSISTPAQLPDATQYQAYRTQLSAAGGVPPYNWTSTPLPSGLMLDRTGLLHGTPTGSGDAQFTATVTDSGAPQQRAEQGFTLTIDPQQGSGPHITTTQLPPAQVGQPYSAQLTEDGGTLPVVWTLASMVPGLNLNPTTGVLTGNFTHSGRFTVTVRCIDQHGRFDTAHFTLTVTGSPGPAISIGPHGGHI